LEKTFEFELSCFRDFTALLFLSVVVSVVTAIELSRRLFRTPPAPAALIQSFMRIFPLSGQSFRVLAQNYRETSRKAYESLYKSLVRDNFDDFVKHWREIPPYEGYFDLMEVIPIESTGCDRNYFFDLLNGSYLVPSDRRISSKHWLCAFVILIHRKSRNIHRFIARLNGPDFLFVLSIDRREKALQSHLMNEFKDNPNVFFAMPTISRCWGCVSLMYAPFLAMTAVMRTGFEIEWFSLNSGEDAVLHSREITKQFLLRYRGKAEFYVRWRSGERVRTQTPFLFPGDCRPASWVMEAGNAIRGVFRDWTVWNFRHMSSGPQWWTLSQRSVKAMLEFMRANPVFILRMSFISVADEKWIPTLMERLGLKVNGMCNLLWMRIRGAHSIEGRDNTIREARNGIALFARKMPAQNLRLVKFLEKEITEDGNNLPSNLVLDIHGKQCGVREWSRVLERHWPGINRSLNKHLSGAAPKGSVSKVPSPARAGVASSAPSRSGYSRAVRTFRGAANRSRKHVSPTLT
jgi:hypothetical protein